MSLSDALGTDLQTGDVEATAELVSDQTDLSLKQARIAVMLARDYPLGEIAKEHGRAPGKVKRWIRDLQTRLGELREGRAMRTLQVLEEAGVDDV